MANREIFSFRMDGVEAMVDKIEKLEAEIELRLDRALTKVALKVIADARRLAPIDTGDLEAALNVGKVKKLVNSLFIEVGASPEVDHYAMIMHEGSYKPGEKTRSKGMHNGYEPGRKYLENAIKMNERWIIEELSAALKMG